MKTEYDLRAPGIETGARTPADPGVQLELNREILRRRLVQVQANQASSVPGELNRLARASLPHARQTVRQHPYASLAGAALAGAILVRWQPWRRLGGSFLIGLLTRQALALSASSGIHVITGLMARARSKRR